MQVPVQADTDGSAAAFLRQADRVATDDDAFGDDPPQVLDVLEENWDAVQVFQLCSQQWVAGMGGAWALGFSALEVHAAHALYGEPIADTGKLARDVLEMGRVAAKELNTRTI